MRQGLNGTWAMFTPNESFFISKQQWGVNGKNHASRAGPGTS